MTEQGGADTMGLLDGKVAVVTGGAGAIGRACCERFAEEGADVVIADAWDEAGLDTLAAVRGRGRRAAYVHMDPLEPEENETVMRHAVGVFGGLDILVAAAGVSAPPAGPGEGPRRGRAHARRQTDPMRRFTDMSLDEWRHVLDVNLTGTLLSLQAAARHMLDAGTRGSIVTVASMGARRPGAGYPVSKAGVWMLTKYAARVLGPAGIRVNAIGPGFVEQRSGAPERGLPELEERLLADVVAHRTGSAREVADAALFLASAKSSYFTGEMLHPDGGFYTD